MVHLTSVLRATRPALLVALGAILAAGIAPVLGARPQAQPSAAVQTRSASCNALNFHPIDDATGYTYEGSEIFRRGGVEHGSGFFVCDPGLPNGAVVTKVQFTLEDADAGEVRYCGLYRAGLTSVTAGEIQKVGSIPSSDDASGGGVIRLSTTSISHATINNAKWSYWLQCQLTDDIHWLGIFGADVLYTISAANG